MVEGASFRRFQLQIGSRRDKICTLCKLATPRLMGLGYTVCWGDLYPHRHTREANFNYFFFFRKLPGISKTPGKLIGILKKKIYKISRVWTRMCGLEYGLMTVRYLSNGYGQVVFYCVYVIFNKSLTPTNNLSAKAVGR